MSYRYECGYAMSNYGCDNGRNHGYVYARDLPSAADKYRAQPAAYPDFCYVIGEPITQAADVEQCLTLSGAWRASRGCCNFAARRAVHSEPSQRAPRQRSIVARSAHRAPRPSRRRPVFGHDIRTASRTMLSSSKNIACIARDILRARTHMPSVLAMSTTPHDALFKAAFSNPEHARGELCAALPPAVAARIDWSTLELVPGSFVDPSLTYRHTDLLFAVRAHAGDAALVYIVYEHQSSSDPMMAFRLLRYLVRIWERWHEDHPEARSLPAIIPLVLYHGETPWAAPLSFAELIHAAKDFAAVLQPYLVDFRYRVDRISAIPDPELRQRDASPYAVVATLSLKHARICRDIAALVVEWSALLDRMFQEANGADALEAVTRYILLVNDDISPDVLAQLMGQQLGKSAKDIAMTAGERLIAQGLERGIAQGLERGIAQGREQGIAQGREQGQRDVLLSLLRQRFGAAVTSETELRLNAAAMPQLEIWMARILTAPSLQALFES